MTASDGRRCAEGEADLPPIVQPYLLVLFSVPFHIDAAGRRWIDVMWAKDLAEHARYIRQLTLAAPAIRADPPVNSRPMDDYDALRGVRCVDLPALTGLRSAVPWFARTCSVLWREIGRTRLVHSAVAGWPIPEAWFLVPMLLLRRRWLYLNVESAFWRLVPGERASWSRRLVARTTEFLNRMCVERSELSTFTHQGYRETLLRSRAHRGHVVEASWIDERNLLSEQLAAEVISRRERGFRPLRLVFAGRLTRAKGVLVLLDAIAKVIDAGLDVELDLFGQGALEAECEARLGEPALSSRVRLRGSLPYGEEFFSRLREYDVLVVPTLSDEQPRIVYDAYSQGLPVIASRTDGLAQCVEHRITGLLHEIGDAEALRHQIELVYFNPGMLVAMSHASLERARHLTHQQTHRKRWRLLLGAFPSLAAPDR